MNKYFIAFVVLTIGFMGIYGTILAILVEGLLKGADIPTFAEAPQEFSPGYRIKEEGATVTGEGEYHESL